MGNMDMNEIDHFMPILMKREEEAETTPMVSHGSSHFLWIKHSNLYRIHLTPCLNHAFTLCGRLNLNFLAEFRFTASYDLFPELYQLQMRFCVSDPCSSLSDVLSLCSITLCFTAA